MPVCAIDRGQRPWNKGLLIGQKKPLEPKHVWSIRVRLEIGRSRRDLVIFNLAIDSKLRACDLVKLRLDDVCSGVNVRHRAMIVQKKTGRPVQFEITEQSRSSVEAWLPMLRATGSRYLFPSRLHASPHISIRQYARPVHRWVESIGLESASWYALDAAYEGRPDLSQDWQPARGTTPPRPYEAREHRPISRD
jgi:integrase